MVPTLTAAENVVLPAEYARRRRSDARKAALDALAMMGLTDRAGHRPMELSGGSSSG